jgi:hypothetical protein
MEVKEEDLRDFFGMLKEAGTEYSNLLAAGEIETSKAKIQALRETVIDPFLEGAEAGEGNVNMTNSQINTSGGPDDIFILAKGDINVGRSTFFTNEAQRQGTGIFTASGGDIQIYAGKDVNVNESRVMTFRGGNILAYTDQGNINAGRGSKTAINAEPPKKVPFQDTYIVVFEPPAVGSGVRTLTYDPDGFEGPLAELLAGDVYLFAPEGAIDAGEAGISGRNVILGATEVINAANIEFAVGSVGVPVSSEGAGGIGALAGAGGLAQTSNLTEASSVLQSARERFDESMAKLADALKPKWLDVKVIDYLDVEQGEDRKDGRME